MAGLSPRPVSASGHLRCILARGDPDAASAAQRVARVARAQLINHHMFFENESIFASATLKSTIQYNIKIIYFIVKTEKRGEHFSNEQ